MGLFFFPHEEEQLGRGILTASGVGRPCYLSMRFAVLPERQLPFRGVSASAGLPRWPSGKEPAGNAGNTRDSGAILGSGRSPGVGNGNPLQYLFLPGGSHGQRSLMGCSPWGRRELNMTEQLSARVHTHTHTRTHARAHTHTHTHSADSTSGF